ncbi:heterogeneous nuclear ribonucleoprotein K-like isoform X2 [Ptychodera flava]|uniref:heterogeneous nuclear ribonucleoprotein K-like isoform X2 n=1 Tax=Ptychodera flava TaxID=63121 RepID=UPI00396A949F
MQDEGNKRPADDEVSGSGKRSRGDGGGPKVDLRILLQSKNAGAIIGKGGSNIKRLRTEYNATVTVPDCSGPERILTIAAKQDTVLECLLDIIPVLEEYQKFKDLNFDCELRMLVHQSQAGAIIGRAGFKIKELREQTGSNIKVYSECCPNSTERVVQMNGRPQVVVECINSILNLLHQTPIKGVSQLYDPFCHDEYEYGGFSAYDDMGRGSGGRGGRGRGGGGPRGRMGPPPSRGGGPRGGMRGGPPPRTSPRGFNRGAPMMRGGRGGSGGGVRGRSSLGGGGGGAGSFSYGSGFSSRDEFCSSQGYNQNFAQDPVGGSNFSDVSSYDNDGMDQYNSNQFTSTQVTIPKDLAGSIIGKGGSRIRQIRQDSAAKIKIDEPLPGSNDRIITITGSPDQIQNAQFLLQNSVSSAASGNTQGSFSRFSKW